MDFTHQLYLKMQTEHCAKRLVMCPLPLFLSVGRKVAWHIRLVYVPCYQLGRGQWRHNVSAYTVWRIRSLVKAVRPTRRPSCDLSTVTKGNKEQNLSTTPNPPNWICTLLCVVAAILHSGLCGFGKCATVETLICFQ